VSKAFDKSVNV